MDAAESATQFCEIECPVAQALSRSARWSSSQLRGELGMMPVGHMMPFKKKY